MATGSVSQSVSGHLPPTGLAGRNALLSIADEHVVGESIVAILSFTAIFKSARGPVFLVEGPGSGLMCTNALICAFFSNTACLVE